MSSSDTVTAVAIFGMVGWIIAMHCLARHLPRGRHDHVWTKWKRQGEIDTGSNVLIFEGRECEVCGKSKQRKI